MNSTFFGFYRLIVFDSFDYMYIDESFFDFRVFFYTFLVNTWRATLCWALTINALRSIANPPIHWKWMQRESLTCPRWLTKCSGHYIYIYIYFMWSVCACDIYDINRNSLPRAFTSNIYIVELNLTGKLVRHIWILLL